MLWRLQVFSFFDFSRIYPSVDTWRDKIVESVSTIGFFFGIIVNFPQIYLFPTILLPSLAILALIASPPCHY